jgi:phosphoribosylformylglycinamidine synthase subunit PurQ / glutaminase
MTTRLDPKAARDVRVLVLTGYGLNCEAETAAGFTFAGATADTVHLGDLLERPTPRKRLSDYHLVAFVGGFSFGDHVASGRVYGNRLRFRLGDDLARFVDDGGLALGICNGFQTLVKLGLLPMLDRQKGSGLPAQTATLVDNDRLGYFDAWVRLAVDDASPCVFTRGLGPILECPTRHGEGKLVFGSPDLAQRVEEAHLIPVRYADAAGQATETWPANPNGSAGGAAGLCDVTGRVFGLMPHPDAYLYPENHPDWIQQGDHGTRPTRGLGARLFENGVRAALGA